MRSIKRRLEIIIQETGQNAELNLKFPEEPLIFVEGDPESSAVQQVTDWPETEVNIVSDLGTIFKVDLSKRTPNYGIGKLVTKVLIWPFYRGTAFIELDTGMVITSPNIRITRASAENAAAHDLVRLRKDYDIILWNQIETERE